MKNLFFCLAFKLFVSVVLSSNFQLKTYNKYDSIFHDLLFYSTIKDIRQSCFLSIQGYSNQ
jgi:hypothetical protein